jgi:hypothetical protein
MSDYVVALDPRFRRGLEGAPVGAGCYSFPEQVGTDPIPARYDETTADAWDAGAHSVTQLDGDVRLAFSINESWGVACGLTAASTPPSIDVDRITHGLLMARSQGRLAVRVIESGVQRAGPFLVSFDDVVEVVRQSGQVSYRHAGALLYRSTVPSAGPVKVAASLYGKEDSVG